MIILLLGKGDTNIERKNLNEPHGDGLEFGGIGVNSWLSR